MTDRQHEQEQSGFAGYGQPDHQPCAARAAELAKDERETWQRQEDRGRIEYRHADMEQAIFASRRPHAEIEEMPPRARERFM